MAGRRYRIAVVIPKYGLVGGAEGFAAELTERLARDPRWEFHVFANRWLARSERVAFHRVPICTFPKFLTAPSFACFAGRRITALGVDLVHTHDRIFRADLATLHGVPHRYWIREVRRKTMSLYDRATARVEDRLIRDPRCRFLLPVSSLTGEILRREYAVEPGRVRVIHPGVDLAAYGGLERAACRAALGARFGIVPEERVVLFVSMNFEIKRLDCLIEALAALAGGPAPPPPCRLLVVGKGNTRKYRELAQSLGVGDRVTFTGPLPGADLPAVYAGADGYAMLSRFDTFGMVVLEAMAAGLPVLVSDHVGAKDLVEEGINGWVLPADARPEAVARRLALLLDPEVGERMGRAALETARANSWDRTAAAVGALYEELLLPGSGGDRG